MKPSIHEQARAQFSKTAAGYVTSEGHAKGAELGVMLELAGDVAGKRVLDIATGGGHTALTFARAGARVTATDLTPEMLEAAQTFIEQTFIDSQGRYDVTFQAAAAEALPFADASFEVVTCRIAAHHFAGPQLFVREAARVLVPAGAFMLVDNIAPEDAALAAAMNHIEKLRDSSHVQAYSVKQWMVWLADAGLEPMHLSRWRTDKPFQAWLERARTSATAGEQLERYVLSLPEVYQRYFKVELNAGRLASLGHEAVLIVAVKMATSCYPPPTAANSD